MSHVLIVCVIGALVAVCVVAPLLAPWPTRARYLVTAQMADPLLGFGPASGLAIREVALVAVEDDGGHVEVVVEEVITGRQSRRTTLTRPACPPSVVARLDWWWALSTPLLMTVDDGDASLHGPEDSVTDLIVAPPRGGDNFESLRKYGA